MADDTEHHALTIIVCGAGPASSAERLVRLAQDRGLTVDIIATPAAIAFLKPENRSQLNRAPVRVDYRQQRPSEPRSHQSQHPIIVAPATYNTICKFARGISDNYALTTLAESLGLGRRVVLLPFVNDALARRRPFLSAISDLRTEGAIVLFGPGIWEPHAPGEGAQHVEGFPWQLALDTAFPPRDAG